MRKSILFVLVFFLTASLAISQVRLSTAYNVPARDEDSVLSGLNSIRGVYYHPDPFGTGQSAIVATNYNEDGLVHLFVNVGNDSLELVWTSPKVDQNGGGSTPRYPLMGDLDNDGLIEIMYYSNRNGIYIYEWDGQAGSYNFGDHYAQLIGDAVFEGTPGKNEYMEVLDIDGDGQNELITCHDAGSGSNDDGFYIISADGNWVTGNPGFSGFIVEKEILRRDYPQYGFSGGTPYGMFSAQFDGDGNKEILLHNWNNKNVSPMVVPAADTYELADTTNGNQNLMLFDFDQVALFGAIATDIDNDGREEVYMPTYNTGYIIHMIHYETGDNVREITPDNVFNLELINGADTLVKGASFGYGYGDIDADGKPNLYFSSSYPSNVVTAEFQGGDKTDPANWEISVLYPGDSTIYSSMTITDSAGVVDTAFTIDHSFASKIWARNTDFDKDGFEDLILPYQKVPDSVEVITKTWNGASYDLDTSYVRNPKIWGLRVIEATTPTGIEEKDLTVIVPDDYKLEQNYPNPFNPATTITFTLPLDKEISLTVYDVLGREVKTLINNKEMKAGTHKVEWDGTDNFGNKVASGNYLYTLKFGNFSKTMKMTLLK